MKYKKITECEMCSFIAKHSDEFGKSVSIPDVKTILQAYESFLKLAQNTIINLIEIAANSSRTVL